MLGICQLCKNEAELQLSHFIPKFVGKWLKKTGITGYLRENNSIKQRSQDFDKEHLLCTNCEQLFSNWERGFANKIFFPFVNEEKNYASYEDWLAKFCTSISWRTLYFIRSKNKNAKHSLEYEENVKKAFAHWSDFLLGEESNLNQYEQHLYHLPQLQSSTHPNLPENINRYFLRAVSMDIIGNSQSTFTYTKLPSFLILGVMKSPESKKMRSSRISLSSGTVSPKKYYMPGGVGEYIFEKCNEVKNMLQSLPEHQKEKIEEYVHNNPEKVAQSKLFEAMLHDYEMFNND
jgi:hypothetical protein